MSYQAVKGDPDWVRDTSSGALIFANDAKIKEYNDKHNQKRKIDTLESDINNMKQEVSEMKGLLKEILERL